MQYVDTLYDDPAIDPCEACDGSGWVMDHEDLFTPCPTCEDHDAAVRAELDAEIDALRWYQEACEALEAREVATALNSDDRSDWERVEADIVPY